MKIINSLQNQQIKNIQKLHSSKGREDQGKFLAEGVRVCQTLISSKVELEQLYVLEEMQADALKITVGQNVTIVTKSVMEKISTVQTPSGLVGIFKIPKHPSTRDLSSGIVLDGISDPGNMGTLIRTAAAVGGKSVVVFEGVDPWAPKVIQASAGTIGQLNIFQISLEKLLATKGKLKLCALVVKDGKKPSEIDLADSLLVIGNEAHGISDQLLKVCDQRMSLPMDKNVESLNAAVAGSIAMYLAFVK